MNLVIATISSSTLAAQNILMSIVGSVWIFTVFGVSTSLAIFVGNMMGMGRVWLAKRISIEMFIIFVVFSMLLMVLLWMFPELLLRMFTDDELVIAKAMKAYYYILVIVPIDTVSWIGIGVLKGLGKIKYIPFI